MKVAIITDTHYGIRNDNAVFLDMTKNFLDNVFFPEIQKQKIKHIIHLGDLVDKRKGINFQTAKRLRDDFIQPIIDSGIEYHQLLGNHDVYYKNTNSVNAIQELYNVNFPWYHTATEINIRGYPILFVPWICPENREHTMEMIKKSTSPICMGHLELTGFQMDKGNVSTHGDDRKIFDKFELTLSGHYHHRSSDGSVFYLGSHGEFNWGDCDDPRGFHILDLKKRHLTFIENPCKLYTKFFYDDTDENLLANYDYEQHANTMVKIIVVNKTNPHFLEMVHSKITAVGVHDLQIVEDMNLVLKETNSPVEQTTPETTLEIFNKYIQKIDSPNLNLDKLQTVMSNLYSRASSSE